MEKKLQQAKTQLLKYGILVNGIETNAKDFLYSFYTNPLSYIILYLEQREYLPKLKALLETLGDKDLCFRGENAIMWAAAGALSYEKLLLLKECKADFVSEHIHDKGHGGRTALHYAASGKDDRGETIKLLVQWGVDVNVRDDGLWTPLHELALCGKCYGTGWAALIDCGADATLKEENGATAEEIEQNGIPTPDEWRQVNTLNGGEDMGNLKMNDDTGDMLYALCKPHMYGRDKIKFIEKVQISPKILKQYFHGERDLSLEHLTRLAAACNMEISVFMAKTAAAYKTDEEKEREREELRRRSLIRDEERHLREEKEKQRHEEYMTRWREEHPLEAKAKEEAQKRIDEAKQLLLQYGITGYYKDDVENFVNGSASYRLRYILKNSNHLSYVPRLAALLETISDEELIYEGENALHWAAYSSHNYEKLLLFKDRAEFIKAHIGDRGKEGRTALHYASKGLSDDGLAIRLLVDWGADVNAQDDYLWTPLHDAGNSNQNNERRWQALIDCGADSSLKTDEGQTAWAIRGYQDALDAW